MSLSRQVLRPIVVSSTRFLRYLEVYDVSSVVGRFTERKPRSLRGSRVKTRVALLLRHRVFWVKVTSGCRSQFLFHTLFCLGMERDNYAFPFARWCEITLRIQAHRGGFRWKQL